VQIQIIKFRTARELQFVHLAKAPPRFFSRNLEAAHSRAEVGERILGTVHRRLTAPSLRAEYVTDL